MGRHAGAPSPSVIDTADLDHLDAQQLRQMVLSLRQGAAADRLEIERRDHEIAFKQAAIDKLTHEMAVLKRLKFAAKSEAFNAEQKSLLEETIDADLAAVERELEELASAPSAQREKQLPKRQALPAHSPRREIRHEPESTTCACGYALQRIGEDVAEKLDYQSGVFTVERHVRGKRVCTKCETLVQAPVAPHIIDKGIPTAGLHSQVLVGKYLDHLPLYRQEAIFGRAGLAFPRSTLASWVGQCGVQLQPLVDALKRETLEDRVLHADETPVAMLKPGNGKTHPAYLWSYCTTSYSALRAVVFDFADGRGGQRRADVTRPRTSQPANSPWRGFGSYALIPVQLQPEEIPMSNSSNRPAPSAPPPSPAPAPGPFVPQPVPTRKNDVPPAHR